jgi:hypothetical protein
MSTGDATVNGNRLDYILRVPYYEVEQVSHPEKSLMEHIRFEGAHLQHQVCFRDGDSYVCAADYLFDRPIDALDIECTLYAAIAPSHVHALHATKSGKRDQAYFDATFTSATLRFAPPTKFGIAVTRMVDGARRGVGGVVQLLFLLTLALAARSRRELAALIGAFAVGMIGGAFANWQPDPRFAECAAALGVGYLAVEILFVPEGGWRWMIAAVLGGFQGIYLALFSRGDLPYFIVGASLSAVLLCAVAGMLMVRRVPRWAAALPLAAGLFWFFVRMRS